MSKQKQKRTTAQTMQRPEPVPPIEVEIKQKKLARTRCGVRCACGSLQVKITRTVTRTHPPFMDRRTATKRRTCVCGDCGKTWPERVRVTEERL